MKVLSKDWMLFLPSWAFGMMEWEFWNLRLWPCQTLQNYSFVSCMCDVTFICTTKIFCANKIDIQCETCTADIVNILVLVPAPNIISAQECKVSVTIHLCPPNNLTPSNNCYNHVTHYCDITQSCLSLPDITIWFSQSHDSFWTHPQVFAHPDSYPQSQYAVLHSCGALQLHVFLPIMHSPHTE